MMRLTVGSDVLGGSWCFGGGAPVNNLRLGKTRVFARQRLRIYDILDGLDAKSTWPAINALFQRRNALLMLKVNK